MGFKIGETNFLPTVLDLSTKEMVDGTLTYAKLDDATLVYDYAFCGTSLSGVYAPKAESIGYRSLSGCRKLYTAQIYGCKTIGESAFEGCTHLNQIHIGKDLTSIGKDAFKNCGISIVHYDGNMEDEKLKECFIILSVIGQISIDLAKKSFDIDVVKEIRRIRNLPCMKKKYVPEFFANTKKSRNDKDFTEGTVKPLNCPMDIIAQQIDDEVISYVDLVNPYSPHEWKPGDVITSNRLNNIETALDASIDVLIGVKEDMSDLKLTPNMK